MQKVQGRIDKLEQKSFSICPQKVKQLRQTLQADWDLRMQDIKHYVYSQLQQMPSESFVNNTGLSYWKKRRIALNREISVCKLRAAEMKKKVSNNKSECMVIQQIVKSLQDVVALVDQLDK